ncbi:putative ubiquitin-protein ligase synoviolin precursor [Triangularia verruculosa]|uniref:RING-type E3 ubiquitin transferase n=1 Tax=Triangularia verruculosa TaxID=2587418 RepID=A0AAN6XG06_9PEZI|nr:putative ubiquitin-protein ligase synoviolin precursor [Triangularia verruculosa]
MRLQWFATSSMASAAAVVASAFYQRANFYSAMVHLAQSSMSLLVLVNLVFVIYGSLMYGFQRLCFGPLRPTEIEQLYERAWFAVTETCLAMTIFRDELGPSFLIMFTALITGKVWGWICEGRVEVLEQQPPVNPRLFHTRLSVSLLVSILYDLWLLSYAATTVWQQARRTVMVMFLFEFAVLTVCSLHTTGRYILSLVEQQVNKRQTQQRLEDRRRQVREQRAEILRRREAEGSTDDDDEELPNEEDVDEMDIEVPGWESKGHWILSLDLFADFVKLTLYTVFFCALVIFFNFPIHIIRDWFMTARSFVKRLRALLRYRQALKDMDQYPDATVEDLGREDTCIICREEMRPWDPNDTNQIERTRAKKLPCGHTLHFGCLKSWLERQQVCPTCRRPVSREGQQPARNGDAVVFRLGLGFPAGQNQPAQAQFPPNGQAPAGQPPQGGAAGLQGNNRNRNVRMFNFGPLRLGFAQGGVDEIREMAQRMGLPPDAANPAPPAPAAPALVENPGVNVPNPGAGLDHIRGQLNDLSTRIHQEMANLNHAAHEVYLLNHLVNELTRLRQTPPQQAGQRQVISLGPGQVVAPPQPMPNTQNQAQGQNPPHPAAQSGPQPAGQPANQSPVPPLGQPHIQAQAHPAVHHPAVLQAQVQAFLPRLPPTIARLGAEPGAAIPAGSPDLPEGVTIPAGWSLVPLQRMENGVVEPNPLWNQVPVNTLRDRLQNLAPERPSSSFSRGTSPSGRDSAAAAGNQAESSQTAEARGTRPLDAVSNTQQTVSPSITSPAPTAATATVPSWGGSAQLFGGRTTLTTHPETEAGSSRAATAASVASETNGPAAASEQNGSASNTKTTRLASVEDAENEEDE